MSKNRELASYTKQLAFLTGKGSSLRDAFMNTCNDINTPELKKASKEICSKSEDLTDSDFCLQLSPIYPDYAVSALQKSESGGRLASTLTLIGDTMENENQMQAHIKLSLNSIIFQINVFLLLICVPGILFKTLYLPVLTYMDLELPAVTLFLANWSESVFAPVFQFFFLTAAFFINFIFLGASPFNNSYLKLVPSLGKQIEQFHLYRMSAWLFILTEAGFSPGEAFTQLMNSNEFLPFADNGNAQATRKRNAIDYYMEKLNKYSDAAKFRIFILTNCRMYKEELLKPFGPKANNSIMTFTSVLLIFITILLFAEFVQMFFPCIHCRLE